MPQPITQQELHPNSLGFFLRQSMPFLLSILVGIGSAAIATKVTIAHIEERLATLERSTERNASDISEARKKENDFERRISRSEATLESINSRLAEINSDVKAMLKKVR